MLPGDPVRTNEEYFKRTGRNVRGKLIKVYCDIPEVCVGMTWDYQDGNVDTYMQGLKVIMRKSDLEPDV